MVQVTRKLGLFFLVLGVAWLGLVAGQGFTREALEIRSAHGSPKGKQRDNQKERYKNLELFQKVLHFVEDNYVEAVDNKELIHGAIKGMLDTLDPHSNFLPPKIYRDMKVDTSGKFGGLGIEIGLRNNVLTIVAPIEDTPAWKAGLKPGDRIVKIDGESTKGLTLAEAVSKMRGKRGTIVTITIYRKTFERLKDVKIERQIIRIRSVRSELLEPSFGYLRLSTFNENASRDIAKALKVMEKNKKLKGLVLDLRTNPGGLLDQAVEVSSLFLNKGVVVSTIGRDKNRKEIKHARKGKARTDFPIAVLVNSSTASAAEIVAGALQDHRRAVVLGQPTFGKGSVQTVIDLGKNMGLKLTIARYYTPNGRSIQEKGVMPDIVLDQYDPKLLAKARLKEDSMREINLPGHIGEARKKGKKAPDFSQEELEAMDGGRLKKGGGKEDMTPLRFEPKSDYQVKQALQYLKSFDLFKKMPKWDKTTEQSEEAVLGKKSS